MVASDWTERHRPLSERQLEGVQFKGKIRSWLTSGWRKTPKPGLLLIGPPVANYSCWAVLQTWVGK